MSRSILIVEDDTRIANWVKVYFERAGFSAVVTHDGRTGLGLARSLAPDLIVLDLMLPHLDGQESGADDYVVKPFDPEEVVARAEAVLRRVKDRVQQVLTCGNISLDERTQRVTIEEQPLNLSHAQFALLAAFMRHPNQILTRDQLIAVAFGDDYDGFDRAIDSHILRLRRRISVGGRQPIQTVYGAGYKFVVEDA